MKTSLFSTLLFAAALSAACSDDTNPGDDGPGKIEVADKQELIQTLAPEAATGSATFTTDGAWRSSIAETRAADWIAISPDHGDRAGTYTIEIKLTPNDTDAARTATVTIVCGKSKIEIEVTQQPAEKPTPDPTPDPTPTARTRIMRIDWYNLDDPAKPELELIDLFTYDEQGRLTRCEERATADAIPTSYHTLVYGSDGTVQHGYFSTDKTPDGTYDEQEHDVVTLVSGGCWLRWTSTSWQTSAWTATYADSRITKRTGAGSEEGNEGYNYVWDKNNLVKMVDYRGTEPDASSNVHLFEYTQTANPFETAVVDPVWLNTHVEYYDDLALGFYGLHSRNLLKSIKLYDDYACTDFIEQTTFEYQLDETGRIIRVDIVNTNSEDNLKILKYGLFTYAE